MDLDFPPAPSPALAPAPSPALAPALAFTQSLVLSPARGAARRRASRPGFPSA